MRAGSITFQYIHGLDYDERLIEDRTAVCHLVMSQARSIARRPMEWKGVDNGRGEAPLRHVLT